jgi:hypothetical protein
MVTTNEPSVAGNPSQGGGRGRAMGDLRARFNVDTKAIEKVAASINQIRKDFEYLNKTLPNINTKLNKTLQLMQGIQRTQSGGAGAQNPTGAGISLPMGPPGSGVNQSGTVTNVQQVFVGNTRAPGGAAPGGAAPGGGGGGASAAMFAFQALNLGIQALDSRIDNNYMRSLSVDKLAVYYQQNKGISNMQYIEDMRDPMRGSRLGYNGINTLLSLQASTGINAQLNHAGIAGLRALSGYSYSTEQMAQMAGTLGSAAVNNRMTMMLGTGLYGFGGQQNSMDNVIKQIVQRTGLTNADRLAGARQQGSNTRAMLEASGVPPDMIDLVLDYAEANQSYQKKTGSKTMYDPSDAKHRSVMGIEQNFATQAEETIRVKENRDEQFYKRQADNFADMEKNIQSVNRALEAFEDKLSGIVGTGVSTKGSIGRKILGGALMVGGAVVGAGLTPFTGGASLAISAGAIATGATLMSGDPVPTAKTGSPQTTKIPIGYNKPIKRITLGELSNVGHFAKLNSQFRDRLLRLFAANPNVGLGTGHRSEAEQTKLFHDRYRPVRGNEKADLTWDGKGWKHHSGPPAAPPGRSMHEIGLAADLVGDLDWVVKNAERFGLKTFANVNNEPWHVQPAELPDSRFEYEKRGSPWGQPAGTRRDSANVEVDARGKPHSGAVVGDKVIGNSGSLGSSYETFSQVSISSIVGEPFAATAAKMDGGGGSATVRGVANRTGATNSSSKTEETNYSNLAGSKQPMDPYDLARLLHKRGFKGKDITNMLAISWRESRWIPGVKADDKDDLSYGLFQINMMGKMGPARRNYFKIDKNEELYDPETNVKAARILFGGGNYSPWNIDGNPLANTESIMPKAQAITKELGFGGGDPVVDTPAEQKTITMPLGFGGGDSTINTPAKQGNGVVIQGGTSVNIAPNIYVTSTGNNTQDAQRVAQEISRILQQEIKRELLRTT